MNSIKKFSAALIAFTVFLFVTVNSYSQKSASPLPTEPKAQPQGAPALPTKGATEKLACKVENEHDEIRKGLRSPPKESQKKQLLAERIEEYLPNAQASVAV